MQFNIIFIFYPFFDPLKNIETNYVHYSSINPLVAVVIHSESGFSATPTLSPISSWCVFANTTDSSSQYC